MSTSSGSNSSGLTGEEIRVAILEDIRDAERLTGSTPTVDVNLGVVTLSGTVESLQDKQLAGAIARRTRGVQAVQNRLLVKRSDRTDDAIQADVEKVLRINDSVAEPRITSNVQNGQVALIGKVRSLAEKRIAEFAASGVKGVTDVDSQITVEIATDRSDEELREEINALIVQSVYFDDARIDVQVNEHVASLQGEVVSAAAKERLESLAEIWGISAVDVSGVSVNEDAADSTERKRRYANVNDSTISEAVRRSFRFDPLVFGRMKQIEIDVDDAVVTLGGAIDRLRVKRRASSLAQNVVGVRRVENDLKVELLEERPDDAEIIRETQAALARSAYLDRRDLRVHCQRAHVSLYGVVDSELEKEVAEYIASGVTGVVHVNNSLVVDPKPSGKTDQEIAQSLRRKLDYALLDDSSNVEVTVSNGVAVLRGEVDTWRQWQAAMELAIEAGAHHPHNLIDVRYHPPHAGQRYYVPE